MSEPRYILAKYVADLGRMEPRNIGVILWHKGRFLAQFLEPGEATFVKSKKNYSRWVQYWTSVMSGDTISVAGISPVPRANETCVDALLKAQQGEYLLVDGGYVVGNIPVRNMPKTVSHLFDELVKCRESTDKLAARQSLRNRCVHILGCAGFATRDDFHRRYPVMCNVYGVPRHLHFHYGLGNGTPSVVLQRVTLSHEPSVNSSALMFHALTTAAMLPKERCAAFVQRSDLASVAAHEGRDLLAELCQVIDVEDETRAVARLGNLLSC